MNDLGNYFRLLASFNQDVRAIDLAHNVLLTGALLSRKPDNVLELGIGTGFVTWSLIYGLQYNKKGRLTCVDNWYDWKGQEPPGIEGIRRTGANVVTQGEHEFLRECPDNEYDFLVSDADHQRSGSWLSEHLRVTKSDGFMFFHDTNSPAWPTLQTIEGRVAHLPHYHFKENSRPEERCSRGWLFVINKK